MNVKLQHLEQNQIEQVIVEYYTGKPVKEILENYRIDASGTHLFNLFPIILTEANVPIVERT
jgi:DNA-binding protein Fis